MVKLIGVESFCESIGFNKKQVDKIKSVLKSESDLSHFKMYIIDNDGKFRSNLELIFNYIKSINLKKSYSVDEFVSDYQNEKKAIALNNISRGLYNDNVLYKVENLLLKGFTLKCIYNHVINDSVNIVQSLNILEKSVDMLD